MTMTIYSYYSELDMFSDNYNGIDGVYKVEYPDNLNLKDEIKSAYKEMTEKEMLTNELAVILNYLKEQGKIYGYSILSVETFDCDYGNFKED